MQRRYTMSKIIYHGSQNIIENPQYGVGKLHNDYGLGFYCTKYRPCKGMVS